MSTRPTERVGTVQLVGLAAAAALGLVLIGRYLLTLADAADQERAGACRALEPQLLAVPAPDFSLVDLEGKQRRLSDFAGKVVLLNFWATWCPPCVEELPSMARLQRAMEQQSFVLLTVSVDESAEVVKSFLSKHRQVVGPLSVWLDPSRKVPGTYGTTKFPESYLIDGTGVIRYRFINKRDWASPEALACIRTAL